MGKFKFIFFQKNLIPHIETNGSIPTFSTIDTNAPPHIPYVVGWQDKKKILPSQLSCQMQSQKKRISDLNQSNQKTQKSSRF